MLKNYGLRWDADIFYYCITRNLLLPVISPDWRRWCDERGSCLTSHVTRNRWDVYTLQSSMKVYCSCRTENGQYMYLYNITNISYISQTAFMSLLHFFVDINHRRIQNIAYPLAVLLYTVHACCIQAVFIYQYCAWCLYYYMRYMQCVCTYCVCGLWLYMYTAFA
jgi:hypothetical protein